MCDKLLLRTFSHISKISKKSYYYFVGFTDYDVHGESHVCDILCVFIKPTEVNGKKKNIYLALI